MERRAGWVVARLRGELTFATCDELAGALAGQDAGREPCAAAPRASVGPASEGRERS
ncbi:MAG TPA: hypothetical protein VGI96_41935 [Streptosporangiaceae bacterium]